MLKDYFGFEQVLAPSNDAPTAFDPMAGTYRSGASFDPFVCAELACKEALHNVFEGLVSVNDKQEIQPMLATGWERLDDVTWRFTIRRGVAFHNGEMLDAEAVRFSLRRASKAYGATAWFPEIARVEVPSPFVADVVLKAPDSVFLHRLAHIGLILPPRYFVRVGQDGFSVAPVGTGAFQFVRWDADQREMVLDRNPAYWRRGYPRVNRLIYRYMDSEQALRLLIDGKLDLMARLNPRKTTELMATRKGRVVKAWLPQFVIGTFNLLKPDTPLRDARVREAINLAINREDLIRYGTIGNGRPIGGYTVPGDPNHSGLRPYPFDPARARQLLAAAGYSTGFDVSMLPPPTLPAKLENIFEASLRQLGVRVTFGPAQSWSNAGFLSDLFLRKFAASSPPSTDIWIADFPAGMIFHSASVPMSLLYSRKANSSAVRDPVLDQLYEEALRTYDPAKASALWRKLEKYVYDNHLLLMAYQNLAVFGLNPRLRFTPRSLMTFWDAYFEQ